VSIQLNCTLVELGPEDVEALPMALNILGDAAVLSEPERIVLLALGAAVVEGLRTVHPPLYSSTLGSAVLGRELAATVVVQTLLACAEDQDTGTDEVMRGVFHSLARELRGVVLALDAAEHGHPEALRVFDGPLDPDSPVRREPDTA
jgi:hypothetical protein